MRRKLWILGLLTGSLAIVACGAPSGGSSSGNDEPKNDAAPLRGLLRVPGSVLEVPYVINAAGDAIHDGDIVLGRGEDVAREWQSWRAAGSPDLSTWRNTRGAGSGLDPQGFTPDRATAGGQAMLHPGGTICYQVDPGVSVAEVQNALGDWTKWWNNASLLPQFWFTLNCRHVVIFTPMTPAEQGSGANEACGSSRVGRVVEQTAGSTTYQFVKVANPSLPGTTCVGSHFQATLRHEIGHLMGLYHEHQRTDRNTYVTVATPNPKPSWFDGNYGPVPPPPNGGNTETGPYDLRSIMHYRLFMSLANGNPLPSGPGPNEGISKGDAAAVIGLYTPNSLEPTFIFGDRPGLGDGATHGGTHSDTRGTAGAGDETFGVLAVAGGDKALWANGRLPQCNGFCGWARLGGIIDSAPGVAITPNRGWGFVAAALGSNPLGEMCLWDNDAWMCDLWGAAMPTHFGTAWNFVPGITGAPAVIGTASGSVMIMARVQHASSPTTFGLLYIFRNPDLTWGNWAVAQASGVASPPALVRDNSLIGWVWLGDDGGLHSLGGGSSFSNFPQGTKLPNNVQISPKGISASSRAPGQIEIFVAGFDGLIWGLIRQNGVWNPWRVYGGPVATDSYPSIVPDTRATSGSGNNIGLRLFFQEGIFPDSDIGGGDFGNVRNLVWTTKILPVP